MSQPFPPPPHPEGGPAANAPATMTPWPAAPAPAATTSRRPSWVAWTALALSALSFLLAASVGILYAVDRFGGGSSAGDASQDDAGYYYDAGLPAWGRIELSPTGAATELALNHGVKGAFEEAFAEGLEGEEAPVMDEVFCEPLAKVAKDVVTTCATTVDDYESTVVLYFTADDGTFLATLY